MAVLLGFLVGSGVTVAVGNGVSVFVGSGVLVGVVFGVAVAVLVGFGVLVGAGVAVNSIITGGLVGIGVGVTVGEAISGVGAEHARVSRVAAATMDFLNNCTRHLPSKGCLAEWYQMVWIVAHSGTKFPQHVVNEVIAIVT